MKIILACPKKNVIPPEHLVSVQAAQQAGPEETSASACAGGIHIPFRDKPKSTVLDYDRVQLDALYARQPPTVMILLDAISPLPHLFLAQVSLQDLNYTYPSTHGLL